MFDTIAAISSGNINQPISIIRMSGPDAFSIIQKIYSGKVGNDKTITYGYIHEQNIKIDEVLIMWFKGPNTFTGEDIIEINAHGGVVNTQKILKLLITHGARLAEHGEFSKRSFLNGKMDLVKAEAIHDLIFAKTEDQAQISIKKFDGQTSELIEKLKNDLMTTIATIETNIDYPEYDDVQLVTTNSLLSDLKSTKDKLNKILDSSKKSQFIFEGVKVAIVGIPNAGKSSILNAILNEDKAIISDIEGTTRDVVEGSIQIGQVLLKFMDTAGIHTSSDQIEKQGIKKSFNVIKEADLILHIIDATKGITGDDIIIRDAVKSQNYLQVFNKSDIKKLDGINVSAIQKDLSSLYKSIEKIFEKIDLDNHMIITNSRQLALIEKSLLHINEAIESLQHGNEPSIVIIDIYHAWEELANILGRADQEDLLDAMFKNFCLGK